MSAHDKLPYGVPRVCEICFNPIVINASYHMVVKRIDINVHEYYHRACLEEAQGKAS